jgi:hypothetical protein
MVCIHETTKKGSSLVGHSYWALESYHEALSIESKQYSDTCLKRNLGITELSLAANFYNSEDMKC